MEFVEFIEFIEFVELIKTETVRDTIETRWRYNGVCWVCGVHRVY